MQNDRILRLAQVLERFPVSKSSWYAGISRGSYPRPVRISPRLSGWRASEIDVLIAAQQPQAISNVGAYSSSAGGGHSPVTPP